MVAHGRPYSPLYQDFCSLPGSELRTGILHVSESFWDFFGMDSGAETFGFATRCAGGWTVGETPGSVVGSIP
jgi:hypothetical protein